MQGKQNQLTRLCFSAPLQIVVWIYDTFDDNFGNKNDKTKYLKESCRKSSDEYFSHISYNNYAYAW